MRHHEPQQRRALMRAFLARFFDNEIASGTGDLKASFFWLLSFVAVPGIFMPLMMSYVYGMVAIMRGIDALRILSRGDKTFYLGYAITVTASLTVITWNSLMVDRRDAIVIGAMPVRPATVVIAKLGALTAYIFLVAACMHVLASIVFGFTLGTSNTFGFVLRGIAAHFVASFAASVFVFVTIAGAQGLTLATLGPRVFAKVSPVLQVCLVALILGGLLILPVINVSVVDTLARSGDNTRSWILATPPLWFLGLYEWVLGTSDPALLGLARKAMIGLAVATLATVCSYPLAYRRLMRSVVESTADSRRPRGAWLMKLLTILTGQRQEVRAVSQFFLSSLGRSDRQRFVLAVGIGAAVAWGAPATLALSRAPHAPTVDLLSLPMSTMLFLLVALRVAAALPSDLKAGWVFEAGTLRREHVRTSMERTMLALGVIPMVSVCIPLYWYLWGGQMAVLHTSMSFATGVLLIELLLWRFDAVPCTRSWNPESVNLGRRWPLYLLTIYLTTNGIPAIELGLLGNPAATAGFVATLLLLAVWIRWSSSRQPATQPDDSSAVDLGNILSLQSIERDDRFVTRLAGDSSHHN